MADFHIWDGVYSDFAQAVPVGPGFDGDVWRQRTAAAFVEALDSWSQRGEVADFVQDRGYHLPVVAATLLARMDRVRVLDVGGGLGTAWLAARAALGDEFRRVDFRILEVENICAEGRRVFDGRPDAPVFVSAMPEDGTDVVHAGSVLQYIGDWRAFVAAITRLAPQVILISDLFAGGQPAFVSLQNYYGSKIPHWFLNMGDVRDAFAAHGYGLISRLPYHTRRLGQEGALPMENFPPHLRLPCTSHALFARSDRA